MRKTKSAIPAAQVNPAARTDLDRKSLRTASVQTSRLNFSDRSIFKSYLPRQRFGTVAVGKAICLQFCYGAGASFVSKIALPVIFEHCLPALPNWEGKRLPDRLIIPGAPASV